MKVVSAEKHSLLDHVVQLLVGDARQCRLLDDLVTKIVL